MLPRSRPMPRRRLALLVPASVHRPPASERNVAHWRINGYPATISIWTASEWENLDEHPTDAQYYPCGIWVALRIDPLASVAPRMDGR